MARLYRSLIRYDLTISFIRICMTARAAFEKSKNISRLPQLLRMAIPASPPPLAAGSMLPSSMEAGPSKSTAAGKWYNPLGPPPGSSFGARLLKEDEDVYTHNAW